MTEAGETVTPPPKKPFNIFRNLERLLGIAAALFGFWGFYQTRQVSSFTYFFSSPAKIFDSRSASNITLSDSQGERITDDVYLQEIVLWNNGNRSIEPRDIRIPITIGPNNSILSGSTLVDPYVFNRFLESKVSQQVSPGVSRLKVRNTKDQNGEPRLAVSWTHFDPGDAAKIQLIYESSSDQAPLMNISGRIVGIGSFTDGNLGAFKRFVPWLPGTVSFWGIVISICGAAFYLLVQFRRKRKISTWVMVAIYFVGLVIVFFGDNQIAPPFTITR